LEKGYVSIEEAAEARDDPNAYVEKTYRDGVYPRGRLDHAIDSILPSVWYE
jgi:hypothetical protein